MVESMDTKRLIAESLKELSKDKNFDKISVGEIAAKSNVNRQTFYYHFQDKYDLLKWIYKEDYFRPNIEGITMENWDECLVKILTSVQKDRAFAINTIRHTEEDIREWFLADTEDMFGAAIQFLKAQPALDNREVRRMDEVEQQFIARFFAYGVCGMVIEWIEKGMQDTPEVVAGRMRKLLDICKQLAYKQMLEEQGE